MNAKRTKGLTLLELVIALAVWLVISVGIFFLWQHTSNASVNLLERQNALENVRGAMDAMISNIEMSKSVRVTTNGDILRRLDFPGHLTTGSRNYYTFTFNNYRPTAASYQQLLFGNNELAAGIAQIYTTYTRDRRSNISRIHIEIHTTCDEPIILHGSVDVRYKNVTFNP